MVCIEWRGALEQMHVRARACACACVSARVRVCACARVRVRAFMDVVSSTLFWSSALASLFWLVLLSSQPLLASHAYHNDSPL